MSRVGEACNNNRELCSGTQGRHRRDRLHWGDALESKPKVGDFKAYLGTMQMEHGGNKKCWADIVEGDGELQSDSTLTDLGDAPSTRVKFASKAGTMEGSQIGSGSMDPMLEKLLDLAESQRDSGQEQGEVSDEWGIKAIIASRPKYKRDKKKGDKYLMSCDMGRRTAPWSIMANGQKSLATSRRGARVPVDALCRGRHKIGWGSVMAGNIIMPHRFHLSYIFTM
nr:uncharacterized protein LOC117276969 [Nicotiana tomentosiformis]